MWTFVKEVEISKSNSGTCSTSEWECFSKGQVSTFASANFSFALLFSHLLVLKSIASSFCFSRWEWAISKKELVCTWIAILQGVKAQLISFSRSQIVARAKIRLVCTNKLNTSTWRILRAVEVFSSVAWQHIWWRVGSNMHVICYYWEYTTVCGHLLFQSSSPLSFSRVKIMTFCQCYRNEVCYISMKSEL